MLRDVCLAVLCLSDLLGATLAASNQGIALVPPKQEAVVYINDSYVVTCKTAPVGLHTMWKGPDGKQITQRGRIRVENPSEGLSLVFQSVEKRDKGKYQCTTSIDNKEKTVAFKLIVFRAITFEDTPANQTAKENTKALVRCEVKGDPDPIVKWELNGKSVEGNPRYSIVEDGLIINKATVEDNGEYNCQAFQTSNDISDMKEKSITLHVQYPPRFQADKYNISVYGYINGTTNLSCEASSEPLASYVWEKDNITIVEDGNIAIHNINNISILQVKIINSSMLGDYICKVMNELGTNESHIKLQEGNKPEVPDVNVIHTTDSTIQLKVSSSDSGELKIVGYNLQFILHSGKTKNWSIAYTSEFIGPVHTIKGLTQDSKYVIRVASRNAAGLSDYSKEIHVTTPTRDYGNLNTSQASGLNTYYSLLIFMFCNAMKETIPHLRDIL